MPAGQRDLTQGVICECSGQSPSVAAIASSAPATFEGIYDNQMSEHSGAPASLTVNSATDFVYRYRNFEWAFNGKIGNSGGHPNGARAMNWQLPDGNHLRFEWVDPNTVRADFWLKDAKAGKSTNKPPGTTAILRLNPAG